MKKLARAILSIRPTAEFVIRGSTYADIEWHTENPPSEEEVIAALTAIENLEYREKRAAEYPSFAEQFDLLYHGGYDAWRQVIQDVKDKYPKG